MILERTGKLRLPSARENVLLLGFPLGHISAATKSLLVKTNPREDYAIKSSLLGGSYNVFMVAWVLSQTFHKWGYLSRIPTLGELRSGAARELACDCAFQPQLEIARRLDALSDEQRMTLLLLSCTDGRGSDVRLSSEELQRPNRVPRTPVDPRHWRWSRLFAWDFKPFEHINILELRSIVLELRRRTRLCCHHNTKYVLMTDSAVCIGVVSNRGSSSRKLNAVVRRLASLYLASGTEPVMVHVRSVLNPADRPSRRSPSRHASKVS